MVIWPTSFIRRSFYCRLGIFADFQSWPQVWDEKYKLQVYLTRLSQAPPYLFLTKNPWLKALRWNTFSFFVPHCSLGLKKSWMFFPWTPKKIPDKEEFDVMLRAQEWRMLLPLPLEETFHPVALDWGIHAVLTLPTCAAWTFTFASGGISLRMWMGLCASQECWRSPGLWVVTSRRLILDYSYRSEHIPHSNITVRSRIFLHADYRHFEPDVTLALCPRTQVYL